MTFKKLLLILEIIGLFILGALLARQVGSWFGLREWLLEANDIVQSRPVDFMALASRTAIGMTIKYACIFLLVFLFLSTIKSGYTFKHLAFHSNGKPFGYQLKVALIILCMGGVIPKFMLYLWPMGLVGSGPEHWQMLNEPWDLGFWMSMLAGSIILPPLYEELFFRGYMQSRLESRFSSGVAIVIMAITFSVFHLQYFQWSIISISMIFSLIFTSFLVGYARYHTGTIIPGMIAHSLVNIPIIGTPSLIVTILMVLYLLYHRKLVVDHTLRFLTLIRLRPE